MGVLDIKESEVKSVELMKLIRNDSKVWEGKLINLTQKLVYCQVVDLQPLLNNT